MSKVAGRWRGGVVGFEVVSHRAVAVVGKLVKEIEVESLEVGYGKIMVLNNLWVNQISINELTIEIDYPYFELNKENNKLVLREV